MNKSLEEYFKLADKAVDLAGEFIAKNFGTKKKSFHKVGLEYGIEEDKKSNSIYEDFLKKETPEVALFTEEGEQVKGTSLFWTVDPIDGTTNYSRGNPMFNSQIALIKDGEPVVAIVYSPILKQKFSAIKGQGAFLNGEKIEVSKVGAEEETIFGLSSGNTREDRIWLGDTYLKLAQVLKTPRIFSSAGLELAYTASGLIDLYVSRGANLWDYAPGVLLIREAGGVVLNLNGKDWTVNDRILIAGNEVLVKHALDIL
ncbi:inositol monophosphatase [Candidatus Daviesbacteria bacterium]|nr:inositol monophosphatase [Candidatus Daviesbacteria bacterium]